MFKAVWQYRHFIASSIKSEIKSRFVRSYFGAAWFILQPLAQSAIIALALSEVLAAKMPNMTNQAGYAIYLMAGMAAWSLFSEITNRCTTVFMDYSSTLKKIAFPRLCLPIIVGGVALINHLMLIIAVIVVYAFLGHYPQMAWLSILPAAFIIVCFAFGLGLFVGLFNVFARDVGHVFNITIQFWFWLTPIIYFKESLPKEYQSWIAFNPMAPLVKVYQDALVNGLWPDWQLLLTPALIAVGLLILAFYTFRQASPELVDAL